jgi:hypothetical protein
VNSRVAMRATSSTVAAGPGRGGAA